MSCVVDTERHIKILHTERNKVERCREELVDLHDRAVVQVVIVILPRREGGHVRSARTVWRSTKRGLT